MASLVAQGSVVNASLAGMAIGGCMGTPRPYERDAGVWCGNGRLFCHLCHATESASLDRGTLAMVLQTVLVMNVFLIVRATHSDAHEFMPRTPRTDPHLPGTFNSVLWMQDTV
jgi:hypothetical protein